MASFNFSFSQEGPVPNSRSGQASFLETAFERLTEGVIFLDATGGVSRMNAEALRIHGYASAEEMHGKIADYTGQFRLETLEGSSLSVSEWPASRVLRGERFNAAELRLIGPKSEAGTRIASYGGTPVYDEDGRFAGGVLTVRDISGEHARREALARAFASTEFERRKFEAIFEDSPASMALLRGPDFIFEKVNPKYKELMGGRDLLNKALHEALPELVDQPFHSLMRRVFETGEPFLAKEMVAKLVRRPGGEPEDTYFDFTYSRLDDGDGKPYGIYIHAVEITESVHARDALNAQKQAFELALREAPLSEVLELLANLVESQAEGDLFASILLVDEQGAHLHHGAAPRLPHEYNQAIHGVPMAEGVGACGTAAFRGTLVVSSDIQNDPLWSDYAELALAHGLRSCWSMPVLSSRGRVIGTFALYRTETGGPSASDLQLVELAARTASIIIERHTSEEDRVRTELALRQSEERLNLALVSSKIGFWDLNAHSGFVFLSKTLMDDWGIDPETFRNTLPECMERIHPDDRPLVWREIERATSEHTPYNVEYRVVRPSGEVIWVNAKGRYYVDDRRQPVRLTGVTINITERRLAEDRLNEAMTDLQAAVRARDEFLSIASHELKTPLTSLKLQAGLHLRLIDKGDPRAFAAERISSFARQSEKQIARLNRLVDDMLDVSRIRSGKLTIETEAFSLRALLEETLERLRGQFEEGGYGLPVLECTHDCEGEWDRLRIEQVITNLLTNAIRYGRGKAIEIRLDCAEDSVLLAVKDQGIGVAPGAQEKIFNRFERDVDANEVSGLGLGLFITKQIVTAHGGKIWVESEPGQGSVFKVFLPKKI